MARPVPLFRCILFVVFVEVHDHTAILQRFHAILINGVVPYVELAEQPAGFQNGDILDLVVVGKDEVQIVDPGETFKTLDLVVVNAEAPEGRGRLIKIGDGRDLVVIAVELLQRRKLGQHGDVLDLVVRDVKHAQRRAAREDGEIGDLVAGAVQLLERSVPGNAAQADDAAVFDVEPLEAQAVVEVGDRLDRVVGQVPAEDNGSVISVCLNRYYKINFMMPGSKGLNPHELAHKWMKDP